ncbi:MAG: YdcF family protein, partial [Burkholderiaceae bacterium]
MVTLGLAFTWLVSCNGFAVWMGQHWLPQVAVLDMATAPQTLRQQKVQAIVVLGGGVESRSREYGSAQPGRATAARIQYGVILARSTGLPMAFSGGQGWA